MRAYLEQAIDELNAQHGLEIELDTIAEIYGEDVVDRMAACTEEIIGNIQYLISAEFSDTVSDICNRYGISLLGDQHIFHAKVNALIAELGEHYAQKLGEDMSHWEKLL